MSPRPAHRFFYPGRLDLQQSQPVVLPAGESHHLVHVLRLGAGERVDLFDAAGRAFHAEVAAPDPQAARLSLIEVLPMKHSSGRTVHLAAAILKRRAMDWMIEKLSEIGVATFQPLLTRRCVALGDIKAGDPCPERWERLALAAAKQCGRNQPLTLLRPVTLEAWLAGERPQTATAFAHGGTGAEPIGQWMAQAIAGSPDAPLCMMIGPEGGWTADEIKVMRQACLQPVSLGELTLRAETAAFAAATACRLFGNAPQPQ